MMEGIREPTGLDFVRALKERSELSPGLETLKVVRERSANCFKWLIKKKYTDKETDDMFRCPAPSAHPSTNCAKAEREYERDA